MQLRSEGIGNKILLIFMLCAALGLFLFLRPLLFAPEPSPRLMDRIPEGNVIGRFYLLDVARETSSMLYKQKVPFREYMTYDFLLSQGKSYGLDLQKPGYFFSNGPDEWGSFVSVTDSSKINAGLLRLSQFVDVNDTLVFDQKIHKVKALGIYLYYDKDFLFVYHGNQIKKRLGKALFAKYGEIESNWRRFENIKTFNDEKLVVFAKSDDLDNYGIDFGLFAHDMDSLQFKLKSYVRSKVDLKIKLKEPGLAFAPTANLDKMLNLHLDISQFKKDKNHPLYKWIASVGKRISFPTDAFFDAWNGDLSYREGGIQYVSEEVIEMGIDEDFNQVEIRKTKQVPVAGFGVLMSVNENSKAFINSLFAKGIINKQGNKYRFLFSPPLKLNILQDYVSAYTSDVPPKTEKGSSCSGILNYKGTRVEFKIDSLLRREVWGSLHFPVDRLLKKQQILR